MKIDNPKNFVRAYGWQTALFGIAAVAVVTGIIRNTQLGNQVSDLKKELDSTIQEEQRQFADFSRQRVYTQWLRSQIITENALLTGNEKYLMLKCAGDDNGPTYSNFLENKNTPEKANKTNTNLANGMCVVEDHPEGSEPPTEDYLKFNIHTIIETRNALARMTVHCPDQSEIPLMEIFDNDPASNDYAFKIDSRWCSVNVESITTNIHPLTPGQPTRGDDSAPQP